MEAQSLDQTQSRTSPAVHFATSTHALREIFLFRERVKALTGQEDEVSYLDERVAAQPEDRVVAVYAEQDGRLVGSAYVHFHLFGDVMPQLARLHRVGAMLERVDKDEIAIVSGMTLHPVAKAHDVVAVLMEKIYELALQAGCSVCYALGSPETLRVFRQMGFRQYGAAWQHDRDGHRVSLAASLRDELYLATICSPVCDMLSEDNDRNHGRDISRHLHQAYQPVEAAGPNRFKYLREESYTAVCEIS